MKNLSISEAVIALDMDKIMNWNATFKGVDDFYKARNYAHSKGVNILDIRSNLITRHLYELWKKEYPRQNRGFIHTCEWEELTVPLHQLKCELPKDEEKVERYKQLLLGG